MPRAIMILLVLLSAMLVAPKAVSQECVTQRVSIDGDFVAGEYLTAGVPVEIPIRLTNLNCAGDNFSISHAWRIYSPDGAIWTDVQITDKLIRFDPAIPDYPAEAPFGDLFVMNFSEAFPGDGEDSVGAAKIAFPFDAGLYDGFDYNALAISLTIDPSSVGKTVCVDIVPEAVAGYEWDWAHTGGYWSAYPEWGGPYCFEVVESNDLGFRPDSDGWGFANTLTNIWPESWWEQFDYRSDQYPIGWRFFCNSSDFPDWPSFVTAFGQDQCYSIMTSEIAVIRPSAVWRWSRIKGDWRGSCTGFAIAACLFFDGLMNVESVYPGCTKLNEVSLGGDSRNMVNAYWIHQFGTETQSHRAAHWNVTTPSQTLQECQDMFNSGSEFTRPLSFWNNGEGGGGHTVNAYRCEQDLVNLDLWYIYIYDNNHPDDETCRIEVDTGTDTWFYSDFPDWGGSRLLFLELPSNSFLSNPTMPKSTPPREEWTTDQSSGVSMIEDYIEVFHSPADEVTYESYEGRIGFSGDSLFSDLTEGIPIIPTTGTEMMPIGHFLPSAEWTSHMARHEGGTCDLSVFSPSSVLTYKREAVGYDDIELIRFNGNERTISVFNNNPTDISYSIDIISVMPDSEIVCGVREISTSDGDSITYSVTELAELRVDNYGAPTTYAFRLRVVGDNTDTVFYHSDILIEANSTHAIAPGWQSHEDSLVILVDESMTGVFGDTLVLMNEEEPIDCCGFYTGGVAGNADCSSDGKLTLTDITRLIDHVFISKEALCCPTAGNVNGSEDCKTTLSDITRLIDAVFITKTPPAGCMPECE